MYFDHINPQLLPTNLSGALTFVHSPFKFYLFKILLFRTHSPIKAAYIQRDVESSAGMWSVYQGPLP